MIHVQIPSFFEREDPLASPTLVEKEQALRKLNRAMDMDRITENEERTNEKVIFLNKEHKAKSLVYGVIKSMFETPVGMSLDDIYIVWSCKVLQNWKFILSAPFKGAPLVEVTYNGDKEETYIDVYKKVENIKIPD